MGNLAFAWDSHDRQARPSSFRVGPCTAASSAWRSCCLVFFEFGLLRCGVLRVWAIGMRYFSTLGYCDAVFFVYFECVESGISDFSSFRSFQIQNFETFFGFRMFRNEKFETFEFFEFFEIQISKGLNSPASSDAMENS